MTSYGHLLRVDDSTESAIIIFYSPSVDGFPMIQGQGGRYIWLGRAETGIALI
ncbi:hypothetical protein GCM10011328_14800 [Hafnia psychrotolerans]|jgi:hypothetical protein|uniref:Uncharacterized protein n=1 Tax=Hafnia psychrotolerans TaxID=1477018 RepID=A0ABQ1GC74_9GAMM|nr:hypothetical protein GCM10011328_14800 [Hafnia psychrotolerans]